MPNGPKTYVKKNKNIFKWSKKSAEKKETKIVIFDRHLST